MSKKPRLGRNMSALLGGASRHRSESEARSEASPDVKSEPSPDVESALGPQAGTSPPSAAANENTTAPDADTASTVDQLAGDPASPGAESSATSEDSVASAPIETGEAGHAGPYATSPAAVSTPTTEETVSVRVDEEPQVGSGAAAATSAEAHSAETASESPDILSSTPGDDEAESLAMPAEARSATGNDSSNPGSRTPYLRPVTTLRPTESSVEARADDRLLSIGVDQIRRGAWQPRRQFDQALLQELADSLNAQGMIQPVLVRPRAQGAYELIAGERRWRAAQLAGMQEIPALVRDMPDQTVAAVSLIENIQRKDLNPLEEAEAFERLCDEFGMTHQAVADAVGRSRAAVSNLMRLLELHEEVKAMVDRGDIEMGHARALLGAPKAAQPELATRVSRQSMTVRAVERLVRDWREGAAASPTPTGSPRVDPDIERLSRALGDRLGTRVAIRHRESGAGRLEISYTTLTELEGILEHIK